MKEKDIQIDRLTGLNEALQKENQSQQEKIVGLYTKVNDFSKLAEETFQDHIDDKSELQKDLKKKLEARVAERDSLGAKLKQEHQDVNKMMENLEKLGADIKI